MNFRTTLILALLALVAAGVVVYLKQQGVPPKKPSEPVTAARLYENVKADDVTRIEIERSAKGEAKALKIVLELVGGKWLLTAPVRARADEYQPRDLAGKLANLAYGRKVELSDKNAAQFGLAPAGATVRFTAAGQLHELAIGQETGLGGETVTYVRQPGQNWVYLAKSALAFVAKDDPASFRDRTLIEWSPSEVAKLALTRGEVAVGAERSGDDWTITAPVRTRGDKEALDGLASAAAGRMGLSAAGFVADDDQAVALDSLAKPRLVMRLEKKVLPAAEGQEPEKPQTMTVAIGGFADLQKTKVYAQISDSSAAVPARRDHGELVNLPEAKVRDLDKDLFALRDKRAVPLEKDKVTWLQLEVAGSSVTVEKSDQGKWQVVAPEKAPADADQVSALIDKLADMKVKKFADNIDPASADYGFARPTGEAGKPYGTITFRMTGQAKDLGAVIGKHATSGDFWILENGTTSAGNVDAADVGRLKTTWLDLYQHGIWQVKDTEQIAAVSWTRGDETVDIVRESVAGESEAKWQMTAPVAEELDPAKVAKLLEVLNKVDAEKFVAPASEAAERGLDQPTVALTVTVQPKSGGQEKTLHKLFMAEKEGKLVAKTDGETPVFEVNRNLLDQLAKPMSKDAWGKFDQERTSRLEVVGPDIDLKFERSGQTWSAQEPPDFPANSDRVRWYVGDLAAAEAAKVVAYAAKDLAQYKLDQPAWRIRAKGLNIDKTFLISDTGPIGGDRYATIEGSGRVVALESSQVSRLEKDKSNFRAGQ